MATWDVFHADRLEVERSRTTAEVLEALASGDLRDDDLIRPAGTTTPWTPIADIPALAESIPEAGPPPASAPVPALPPAPPAPEDLDEPPPFPDDFEDEDEEDEGFEILDDDEDEEAAEPRASSEDDVTFPVLRDDADEPQVAGEVGLGRDDLDLSEQESRLALPVSGMGWDEPEDEYDPQEEDEEAAEFTLSRGGPEKVEELDLAAMVDVAFQLVLFFLVTATTVLYKSLEVPKPNPDSPAAGAAQGRSRTLDDLKNDYILVEIDATGSVKIDREPVAPDMATLVERLRKARESTRRQAMLLTADFATPHRNAVLAYDAANEIGLGIAIARPSGAEPAKKAPPAPAKKPARG